MVRILFVCSGNICRSPIAQGVFEAVLRREGLEGEIFVDSAGTHAFYHDGEPPDPRAQRSAEARGLQIGGQRARMIEAEDCQTFDYVLVADEGNLRTVRGLCRNDPDRVRLLLDYAPHLPETEIPDPYYGGPDGFEHALDLIEEASEGLLADIRERHLGSGI
jgi:protein-tyrosine phosphatase